MTNDKWQMTNQEIDVPGSSSVTGKNRETWTALRHSPRPAASEGADVLSVICHSGESKTSRETGVSHLSSHLYGLRVVLNLLFPAPTSML
jgi:hypothetical protein